MPRFRRTISDVAASVSEWRLIHSLTLAATSPTKPKLARRGRQASEYRTRRE